MKPTESEDNISRFVAKDENSKHLYTIFYHCHVRYDSNNPLMQVG
jgi:hypothetical protein